MVHKIILNAVTLIRDMNVYNIMKTILNMNEEMCSLYTLISRLNCQ